MFLCSSVGETEEMEQIVVELDLMNVGQQNALLTLNQSIRFEHDKETEAVMM